MRRDGLWLLLLLVLALAACKARPPLSVLLPESVAGGWRRVSLGEPPVSEAPDPVPRVSVTRFEAAVYEGPGKIEARVYELSSTAAAADLVKRWRPSADTVFFDRGEYLVVLKWDRADRQALRSFVLELENRLPK